MSPFAQVQFSLPCCCWANCLACHVILHACCDGSSTLSLIILNSQCSQPNHRRLSMSSIWLQTIQRAAVEKLLFCSFSAHSAHDASLQRIGLLNGQSRHWEFHRFSFSTLAMPMVTRNSNLAAHKQTSSLVLWLIAAWCKPIFRKPASCAEQSNRTASRNLFFLFAYFRFSYRYYRFASQGSSVTTSLIALLVSRTYTARSTPPY